jgi:hypothetical protein
MRWHCRWGHHGHRKRNTLLCWYPSRGMSKLFSVGWPSSRVNMRRLTEPGRWPKRKFVICQTHRLRVPNDWRPPRRGIVNSLRSSPFCALRVLSCASPSLVHHW